MNSTRVFHLIERIGALLRSETRRQAMPHDLQPVHMQALDYLSRANRFSDTPLAVGEYLGLTKGNMSQRLNVLENLDLIRKSEDEADGRVVHLQVTAAGKRLLQEGYPPASWREIEEDLSEKGWNALEAELVKLLHALLAANDFRLFEQCKTCRFYQRQGVQAYCGLLKVELAAVQTEKICREHQPVSA
jgi:DNA-binding MarR family transcriptional regulator